MHCQFLLQTQKDKRCSQQSVKDNRATSATRVKNPAMPSARLNDAVGQAWCRLGLHIQYPVSSIQYYFPNAPLTCCRNFSLANTASSNSLAQPCSLSFSCGLRLLKKYTNSMASFFLVVA